MATYQTRRRARLTPLGKLVFGGMALVVLICLMTAAKATAARLGDWLTGEDRQTRSAGDRDALGDVPGDPPGAELASGSTEALPDDQVGNHPDAQVVVTYQVATAGPVEVSLEEFANEAQEVFDDHLGWLSAGVGFDRVREGADFTLWLATPDQMVGFAEGCASEYSCRVGPNVIINQERWLTGALPGALDGVGLSDYRTMAINHEVGHWLGHDHTGCPGSGQPSPLMMQQSKGLDGCSPNIYPLPEERTAPSLGL
ncbi:MAG: DUF3152 domain-containing protein [Bifidobacteriaceae bacterium]|jgi:hypothetical protein|nr:DUF3152 domain-containing protein [Bifidobacteriaceae bacterium]